jgi:hypothetical protein
VIFLKHGDSTKRFKIQFPRAPYFFFVNFELGFSVTASWIVLKLQFILLLFIMKSKKEKYGALEERRIFQIKKDLAFICCGFKDMDV